MPKAPALLALLLSVSAYCAEIERVPELAPATPLAPVVSPVELPQLQPQDLSQVPTLSALPQLSQTIAPSVSAQAQAASASASRPKPGAMASIQALSARMSAPKADDSSRRENLEATFDQAKPRTGDGPVDGSGGSGGGNDGGAQGPDDGGGPNYPVRTIRALGTTFKAVLFRPNVPVEAEIVRALDQAQKGDKVRIAIYEFGNGKTLDALRRARKRGVDIRLIIDYSNVFPQRKGGGYAPKVSKEIWGLMREGFNVKVLKGLGEYGIAHNKIMVVQSTRGSLAVFGSYNWKWTAEQDHYENANFTSDRKRIEGLYSYWNWLDGLSTKAVYNHADGSIELADKSWTWPKTVQAPPQFPQTVEFNGIELPFLVVSPASEGGASAEDEISRAYDAAKVSIQASIFALRSTKMAQALLRAKQRGLKVQIIIDKGQSESDAFKAYAQWLAFNGIETRVLSGPDPSASFQLAQKDHHKFSLLDGKLIETGSTNYTKYGSIGNYENAHFLDDPTDAKSYQFMFDHMWSRAQVFQAPSAEPTLPTDEQLIDEVFPKDEPPAPAPNQGGDEGPLPSWPKPAARQIPFNGHSYASVILKPDTVVAPMLAQLIKSAKRSVRLSAYEFNLPEMLEALRWLRANKPKVKIEVVLDRSHVYTSGRDHTGGPRKPSPEIVALIREGFDVLVLKGQHSGIMHSKYLLIDAPAPSIGGQLSRAAQTIGARALTSLAAVIPHPMLQNLAAGAAQQAAAPDADGNGLVLRGSYNFAVTAENNHYENIEISTEKDRVQNYLNDFRYKRGLAEPVDHDKLDEILARTDVPTGRGKSSAHEAGADGESSDAEDAWLSQAHDEQAEPEAARGKPLPPPPESSETPVDINGEKFKTEYFSPNGGIMDAWLRGIKAAKESVDIAMFGFYSRDVAEALVNALNEKRKENDKFSIRLVLDAGQASLARFDKTPGDRTSGVRVSDWLKQRGIDVKVNGGPHWRSKTDPRDPMFEKMHSKYMIIDGKWVFTGSWNASDRAEQDNFENMTVIPDPTDVSILVWDFERLFIRSLGPGEREPVNDPSDTALPGL